LIELTNLKELSMKQNQLKGSIPEFLLYLSNLEFLDFHGNNLNQQIPAGFGKLTSLRHLILKQNALSGQLPAEMGQMTALQVLLMEQNNLEGTADAICGVNTFRVEVFVADCGDEFVQFPSPPWIPGDNNDPTVAPANSEIIDDDPNTVATLVPMPATPIPVASPTENPSLVPTIANGSPEPTRFDDDKVFTPDPTTNPPVFDDDPVVSDPPGTTPDAPVDSDTGGGGVGDFDDLSGNNDNGTTRRRMAAGHLGCSCCTICCDPGDNQCNKWDWKGNLDPIWEHGYKRRRYSYDLGPVVWLP